MDWEQRITRELKNGTGLEVALALSEVDAQYGGQLLRIAEGVVGSDAEDVYSRLLSGLPAKVQGFQYRGEGSLLSWLKVVVRNLAIDQFRRNYGHARHETPASSLGLGQKRQLAKVPDQKAAHAMSAVEEADERESLKKDIERVLGHLSSGDRNVIAMVDGAGLTSVEYGELAGISSDAVRQRLLRARRRFTALASGCVQIQRWRDRREAPDAAL